mmetsp:Transcript_13821/g.44281  ORF Transcript_13821/g.44281 Transcript_13821/m.44281 type:complete len:224 (+) Transcript_13821:998-1669(+)
MELGAGGAAWRGSKRPPPNRRDPAGGAVPSRSQASRHWPARPAGPRSMPPRRRCPSTPAGPRPSPPACGPDGGRHSSRTRGCACPSRAAAPPLHPHGHTAPSPRVLKQRAVVVATRGVALVPDGVEPRHRRAHRRLVLPVRLVQLHKVLLVVGHLEVRAQVRLLLAWRLPHGRDPRGEWAAPVGRLRGVVHGLDLIVIRLEGFAPAGLDSHGPCRLPAQRIRP